MAQAHRDDTAERKLTVVIPAFNEEQTIGHLIEELRSQCDELFGEIIVVDDGSTDATARIAEGAGARVIRHPENLGYGAALKTGIRSARTEFVVTMDSDGQHRAADISSLVKAADSSDMVVGQRRGLVHSPLWRMPGKWLLSVMANYLTRRTIPDLNSGLRVIRRDVGLRYLHVCPRGFSFSATITMVLLMRGYKVTYVPIEVRPRVGKSTVSLVTGLDTVVLILRIASLFDPLRIFIPTSLGILTVGLVWGIPNALLGRGVTVGSMLAITTSILVFSLGLICDQISQLRLERFE